MVFTVELGRIRFGYNGSQKDVLSHFGLKYHRVCGYKLNDEYDIIFLNTTDPKGWRNNLSKDGLTLYESHIDNTSSYLDISKRQKKRITFIKSNTYDYGGYSFIGVFQLDNNYDWSKDTYPTGKPMDPRVKYNRIQDHFNI